MVMVMVFTVMVMVFMVMVMVFMVMVLNETSYFITGKGPDMTQVWYILVCCALTGPRYSIYRVGCTISGTVYQASHSVVSTITGPRYSISG